jgi:glyoxylase-like metal-dependent hydrolase (beta-lactamase superfamily II)
MSQNPPSTPLVERFESDNGAKIYRLRLEAFPKFYVYSYLLLEAGPPTLIDCGSNTDSSHADLLARLEEVRTHFEPAFQPHDIERIFITHGHIDHHGGLNFIHDRLPHAQIAIHPLDRRILSAYEERVVVASKNLRVYLERAGVKPDHVANLMEMYAFAKRLIRSESVDFTLDDGLALDGMTFIHVPGHCSGQVCIRVGDILLTADHILSRITPHQAPESITRYMGLGHYLESLDKVAHLSDIRLALGGHEAPIHDLYGRIAEIKADHQQKLTRICELLKEAGHPMTISDISKGIYTKVSGYNILLALEEIGAHVEYLYERGELAISNLAQVENEDNPPLCYSVL